MKVSICKECHCCNRIGWVRVYKKNKYGVVHYQHRCSEADKPCIKVKKKECHIWKWYKKDIEEGLKDV